MRIRRTCLLLPLVISALATTAFAQEAGKFAGTWKAEHAGNTYIVISIAAGTPLKISFSAAEFHANENGDITEIRGPAEHEETVLESKIDGATLSFKTRQENGYIIEYKMKLEGGSAAFLTIVEAPANVKPFRLRRT